jgi:hypothetical protein
LHLGQIFVAFDGGGPSVVDRPGSCHPITYKSTLITTKGDDLDRYLLGRQFMVSCWLYSLLTCVVRPYRVPHCGDFWNSLRIFFFLLTGLAMGLYTCMNSQVNASDRKIDYINTYFAFSTLWVARGIGFFRPFLHALCCFS